MSALALEAPQQITLAPVSAPRRRPRAERGPVARPQAAPGPVCAPLRREALAQRPVASACTASPAAPVRYRLTERGIAVITGSTFALGATAVVAMVAQFLALTA